MSKLIIFDLDGVFTGFAGKTANLHMINKDGRNLAGSQIETNA